MRRPNLLLPALLGLSIAGNASAANWDEAASELRSARVAEAPAVAILRHAQAQRLPPVRVVAWAHLAQRLARRGVPVSIAGDRLLQGLAKGVAADRIDAALGRLEDDLFWALAHVEKLTPRAALRTDSSGLEQALREMEAALRSGLTRAEIEQVLGPGPLTLGQVGALARLAGSLRSAGADAGTIRGLLEGAGTAGLKSDEIERLHRALIAAMAQGAPLDKAVADLAASLGAATANEVLDRRELLRKEAQEGAREAARSAIRGEARPGLGRAGPDLGSRPGR